MSNVVLSSMIPWKYRSTEPFVDPVYNKCKRHHSWKVHCESRCILLPRFSIQPLMFWRQIHGFPRVSISNHRPPCIRRRGTLSSAACSIECLPAFIALWNRLTVILSWTEDQSIFINHLLIMWKVFWLKTWGWSGLAKYISSGKPRQFLLCPARKRASAMEMSLSHLKFQVFSSEIVKNYTSAKTLSVNKNRNSGKRFMCALIQNIDHFISHVKAFNIAARSSGASMTREINPGKTYSLLIQRSAQAKYLWICSPGHEQKLWQPSSSLRDWLSNLLIPGYFQLNIISIPFSLKIIGYD